eukprot:2347243-Amphidinium_carterae.1
MERLLQSLENVTAINTDDQMWPTTSSQILAMSEVRRLMIMGTSIEDVIATALAMNLAPPARAAVAPDQQCRHLRCRLLRGQCQRFQPREAQKGLGPPAQWLSEDEEELNKFKQLVLEKETALAAKRRNIETTRGI